MKPSILTLLALLLGLSPQPISAAESKPGVAYAGWAVLALDPAVREEQPVLRGAGLGVVDLDSEGPAAKAGVNREDILVQLDDQRLFTPGQLRALLRSLSPGGSHKLRVLREGAIEELDLRLGEQPSSPEPTRELRQLRVPFELWNSESDWATQLADVVQQEPPADQGTETVEPSSLTMWLGDATEAWSSDVEVVILLQRESAESATPEVPIELPFPQPPADFAEGVGNFAATDEQGSVEVTQRGGRDHVIVRDWQGAVLYEGTMDSENDALLLRPLRPGLRQAVESSVGPDRVNAPRVDIDVWRVPMPPRIF